MTNNDQIAKERTFKITIEEVDGPWFGQRLQVGSLLIHHGVFTFDPQQEIKKNIKHCRTKMTEHTLRIAVENKDEVVPMIAELWRVKEKLEMTKNEN